MSARANTAALILALTRREIAGRYRGSVLGVFWSLLLPLALLALYTFVFGMVMKVRWNAADDSTHNFALTLFCGLILHQFLSECLIRAPRLMIEQANFVKKIVFPLEILPVVVLLAALFQYAIGLSVLLAANLIITHTLPLTLLWLPFILLPFALLTLGLMWILAALGVYVRDIAHGMGLIITILLFFSTVFYPADHLPAALRPLVYLNPLSFIVDSARSVVLWGQAPNITILIAYSLASACIFLIGYALFRRLRPGFAEAL